MVIKLTDELNAKQLDFTEELIPDVLSQPGLLLTNPIDYWKVGSLYASACLEVVDGPPPFCMMAIS